MFESERLRYCVKRKYVWLRGGDFREGRRYYSDNKVPKFEIQRENVSLDIETKKAVLKASSSVVALSSYSGEQELAQCCGVVIENDGNNLHTILTSARLIRSKQDNLQNVMEDKLADSLKVIIYLYNGSSFEGQVCAYDFHYNIAWIQFQSDSSFPTASMRQVDDYINVNPAEDNSSYLRHINDDPAAQKSSHNLIPGHAIVSVGRYFTEPFDLMAAPGEFVVAPCDDDFDCKELLKGTCSITQCGEGGALINLLGEVIGITFYVIGCFTPFLPIQIAQKCWEHYKRYGRFWRPFLGIVATNLYAADISDIEKVIQKIPSICNGVFVEEVIQGSSLDSAGLHVNDVIFQCDGKTVHSFLEFSEMVWEKKVGDVLQLAVVRVCENEPILVDMVVDEVGVGNFNRWPRM